MRLADFGLHISRELLAIDPNAVVDALLSHRISGDADADDALLDALARRDPKRAADKRRAIEQRRERVRSRVQRRGPRMVVTTLASLPVGGMT